jgi:hypothetical protein
MQYARLERTTTMRYFLALVLLVQSAFSCLAACRLEGVVGYTLVAKKTVVAFVEDNKREDGFTGCNFNRVLVFDDNTGILCTAYNYHYAYNPDAYLFVRSSGIKACIDGEWFEATTLR